MNLSEYVKSSSNWKDVDVIRKYKKYPQFKKELDKAQKQYLHDLNMSLYSDLQHLHKFCVLQPFQVKQQKVEIKLYLNFYAFKMQFEQDEQDKFYLLFIRILDQKLRENKDKKYSIIYYHCLSESTFPFSFLNETFKKLPIFYYAMLDKIIVVEPNFLVKNAVGMFDFGRLHKLFTKRIQYVDNLYQLGKNQQVTKSGVLQSLPQILRQQKALKQQKKALKHGALQNIQNKEDPHKEGPSKEGLVKMQFSEPITIKSVQKQDYLTIALQSHKSNSDGMPIALLILLETLKNRPEFLSLQGIFRKSGSIQEEQQIISELSKMTTLTPLKNIDEHSGYAVAGVVKKFFTKLSTPIIPYDVYNEIMKVSSVEEGQQIQFVRSIFTELPAINKRVLINLILFLKEQVISKQDKNKMNNYNMSVCFCPCIFRARQATLQDLMNSGKYAKILDILFSKFEEIFPKDQIKLVTAKENIGSKGSKESRGSRSSKQNRKQNNDDSPTRILI